AERGELGAVAGDDPAARRGQTRHAYETSRGEVRKDGLGHPRDPPHGLVFVADHHELERGRERDVADALRVEGHIKRNACLARVWRSVWQRRVRRGTWLCVKRGEGYLVCDAWQSLGEAVRLDLRLRVCGEELPH